MSDMPRLVWRLTAFGADDLVIAECEVPTELARIIVRDLGFDPEDCGELPITKNVFLGATAQEESR